MENPARRKLKEGEFCNVELKYTADKNFKFYAPNKIESFNDVAYIFENLERASVENLFCVYVTDGKPIVQHLSMGGLSSSVADTNIIADGIQRFKADRVFFVHNHPSGNINASMSDIKILQKLRKEHGISLIEDGIIIDTNKGVYGVFNDSTESLRMEKGSRPKKRIKLPVLKFDRQVFRESVHCDNISSSADVARVVSQIRLTNKDKLSALILKQNNEIAANIHLSKSDLNSFTAQEINAYTARFGGASVIIYGRTNELKNLIGEDNLQNKINAFKEKIGRSMLDYIEFEDSQPKLDKSMKFNSAADMGLSM